MNRRVFTLAALAVAGCATAAPPPAADHPPVADPPRAVSPGETPTVALDEPLAELEPLYRVDAGREALTISVASNGCTAKADFTFHLETKGQGATLAFARKRLDRCRSFAMGRTDLTFTWAELGVAPRTPVFLLNPLLGWTGPGS